MRGVRGLTLLVHEVLGGAVAGGDGRMVRDLLGHVAPALVGPHELVDGRPRLQRRTLQVFHKRPAIFEGLLQLHVGVLSPLHLAVDGLSLGWGLLTV